MIRKFLLLFAVIYLSTIPDLAFAQKPVETTLQVRQKTFEKVWQTVNDTYFDPNFGGIDWKRMREIYAPQVAKVKNNAELYKLLDKMLGAFKVSHMRILTPEMIAKLKAPPVTTGMELREIENRIVITRLFEVSSAAKSKLKTGYAVIKINGTKVINIKDAKAKISGVPNTSVRISYLDERDRLHETVLKRESLNQAIEGNLAGVSIYALFESKRLSGDIGYLRFSNFAASLEPKIKSAIESMKDAPGIIIDLRGNSGGDDQVAINLAGMLFDKETQLMVTRTREGADLYYKAKPQNDPYLGKIVILVDEQSGSASEQFAAGMQESERAIIIGKKTEGEDLDADLEQLPTGAFLLYANGEPRTPKGVVIEGRGVVPNEVVNLSRATLLGGRDLQLEAAIDYCDGQEKQERKLSR